MAPCEPGGEASLGAPASSAQHFDQLPGGLQLTEIEVGPGSAFAIFNGIQGIESQALPKLMATGSGDFRNGLLFEHSKAALQVLDLGDGHSKIQRHLMVHTNQQPLSLETLALRSSQSTGG